MSIALFNAITGLANFQKVLDVVGNNLSNMSTPGYKRSKVAFKELLSQTLKGATKPGDELGGSNPTQLGLGSSLGTIDTQYTQGLIQVTGRPTDLAITGDGFFVVKDGDNQGYTRNGSFSVDVNGNLVDLNGYKVQGWNAVDGVVTTTNPVEDIDIPVGEASSARATTEAGYSGNLDASQALYNPGPPPTGGIYTTEGIVYDTLGEEHTLSVTFTKVAPGAGITSQWDWTCQIDGNAAGAGTIAFDTEGQYDAANSTANPQANYAVGGGADPLSIDLDYSAMTQLASGGTYSASLHSQDGVETGTLETFNIDEKGNIIGTYSNGISEELGQLAMANFMNPEGLEKGDGSVLWKTSNTGEPKVGEPGTGSRGTINAGSLELSNVDMSTEFTNMIIAQRAFQANSRVVSVMDQVLEEMANLKR